MNYRKLIIAILLINIITLNSCCILALDCLGDFGPIYRIGITDASGRNLLDTTKTYGDKLLNITIRGDSNFHFQQVHTFKFDSTVFSAILEFHGINETQSHEHIITDTFYLKFDSGLIDTMISERSRKIQNCCPQSEVHRVKYNQQEFIGGQEFVIFNYIRQ